MIDFYTKKIVRWFKSYYSLHRKGLHMKRIILSLTSLVLLSTVISSNSLFGRIRSGCSSCSTCATCDNEPRPQRIPTRVAVSEPMPEQKPFYATRKKRQSLKIKNQELPNYQGQPMPEDPSRDKQPLINTVIYE